MDLAEVILGNGPSPSFVISAIRRLPDDSLTVALMNGGREYFGWGTDRFMRADTYDAINQVTRAAGNWAKKPPEIPPYPRPAVEQEKKPTTVASLYDKFFKGR